MARYTNEDKALMLYGLQMIANNHDIFNEETIKKISALISKIDKPFLKNAPNGFYNELWSKTIESWEIQQ
jgi:hypothetical protein